LRQSRTENQGGAEGKEKPEGSKGVEGRGTAESPEEKPTGQWTEVE